MNWIFIVTAVIIELLWIISIIACIKDRELWEDCSKFITIMTMANILSIIIWLKHFV